MWAELVGGQRCISCGAPGACLCDRCADALPAAPAIQLPEIDRASSAWPWVGAPRRLILDLKLRSLKACAPALGRGAASAVWRIGSQAEVVTWVPGSARDIRRRGFDHAEVIARQVAQLLGLGAVGLLERSGPSRDQVGLSRSERLENRSGGFVAKGRAEGIVLLVDDLITTGATARACARALRAAGADGIEVATPCRA